MRFIPAQTAEGRRQKGCAVLPAAYGPLPACPHGFTLIEMLVVMGIIVLAIAMAVPTIRALTGSKSQSVAQNTISAFLARTRAEAIGLQQVEGVLFFVDPATGRVNLAQVYATPQQTGDQTGVTYLDLVPDRDQMPLPSGLRLFTLLDGPPTGSPLISDLFQTSTNPVFHYMGYNDVKSNSATRSYLSNITSLGGVILFDGNGRTVALPYGLRFLDTSGNSTAMGTLAFQGATPSGNWPNTANRYFRSQIAFVLVDQQAFDSYRDPASNQRANEANRTNTQTATNNFLDTNTTPILVNHYNGTLTVAE